MNYYKFIRKYIFYKGKYEKICKENYLENKIKKFDCDEFVKICISIFYAFYAVYCLGYVIGLPLGKFNLVSRWSMIIFIILEILLILLNLYKNKCFKLK